MYKTEVGKIIVDKDSLDVRATLECGQIFRFQKTDKTYTVKSGGNSCKIYYADDGSVVIETPAVDYFVSFFDLDRDVDRIKRELLRFPELEKPLGSCGVLRILRQPLFETIISFIISANNNIPRIKGIIDRLCAMFDDVFPTPQQIADLSVRQLDAIGCGYRSQYIYKSAKICAETDILNKMLGASTADAEKMLISLPGVGPKIADCVMLFALSRQDVFPVDTWILRTQRSGMETEIQLRRRLIERYGGYSGYAQQFIYYYNAILRAKD